MYTYICVKKGRVFRFLVFLKALAIIFLQSSSLFVQFLKIPSLENLCIKEAYKKGCFEILFWK